MKVTIEVDPKTAAKIMYLARRSRKPIGYIAAKLLLSALQRKKKKRP